MNIQTTISLCSVLVSLCAIGVSIWTSQKALKSAGRLSLSQTKANLFITYTNRYMQLVKGKPDFSSCTEVEQRAYMRQYFNLCSEEFYLYKKELIDECVWQMWVEGMRLTMKNHKFQASWRSLSVHYDEAFWPFFEKEVLGHNNL